MPLWLTALGNILASALAAIVTAIAAALRTKRQDAELTQATEGNAVETAANETQQTISEIADERAAVPDSPDDADELIKQLRSEKSTARGPVGPGSSGAG